MPGFALKNSLVKLFSLIEELANLATWNF